MKRRMVLLMALSLAFSMTSAALAESTAAGGEENGLETLKASLGGMTTMQEVVLDESRENTQSGEARYEEVVLPITNAPADILPMGTDTIGKQELQSEIYEPLALRYAHDEEELWGVIAKSWEDVDELHTKVEIYDYVKDSNGNPITADDIVFSYDITLAAGLNTGFGCLEKVEALDDYTVQFTWTEELGVTDFANIMSQCYIVAEESYDEDAFITNPVGSGPYCLTDYTAGVSYTLTANDDYWQTDESVMCPLQGRNVQTIRYDVISDTAQTLIAFEKGDIDNVSLRTEDLGEFQEGGQYYGQFAMYYNYGTNCTGILPNCSENSICNDINFRLAMYYAIDAQTICNALGVGQYSTPVGDAFPGLYDYNEEWGNSDNYYNHYDVELAKEYLAKTDYNGEKLVILIDSDPDRETCGLLVMGFLNAIGINSEIQSYEHAIASVYINDPAYWDITIDGCGAEGSITLLWDRRYNAANFASGMTKGFADDAKLQELLAAASKVSTHSQDTVDAFSAYLSEQAYFYGLYTSISINATTPDIGWFALNYKGACIPGGCIYYLD